MTIQLVNIIAKQDYLSHVLIFKWGDVVSLSPMTLRYCVLKIPI